MKNETHLSTQQDTPQEDLRLSLPHEDGRGPQGHQSPPPRRTQSPGSLSSALTSEGLPYQAASSNSMTPPCLTGRFPKLLKLRKRSEFQRVQKQGQRLVGQYICIDWKRSSLSLTRLGITASKRFGAAHERNRFKRLVREAFRTLHSEFPPSIDLNVSPRQFAKNANLLEVRKEFQALVRKCH